MALRGCNDLNAVCFAKLAGAGFHVLRKDATQIKAAAVTAMLGYSLNGESRTEQRALFVQSQRGQIFQ